MRLCHRSSISSIFRSSTFNLEAERSPSRLQSQSQLQEQSYRSRAVRLSRCNAQRNIRLLTVIYTYNNTT